MRAFLHAARNAMQRSQTALSMLRLKARESAELLELVAEAEHGNEELDGLYEAARRYVAPVVCVPEQVNVPALIEKAWESVVPEGADAILTVEPTLRTWRLDPSLLQEAIREILRNSLQARPEGLRVHARCLKRRSQTSFDLELRLKDNGPGLTEQQREYALEPFWSGLHGHRGMGLAIASKAVKSARRYTLVCRALRRRYRSGGLPALRPV